MASRDLRQLFKAAGLHGDRVQLLQRAQYVAGAGGTRIRERLRADLP